MALSEAKKAADKRHTAKLDNIMIRPYREEGTAIRAAARAANKSVQGYVLEAVREKMERDGARGAGSVPSVGDGITAADCDTPTSAPGVVTISSGGEHSPQALGGLPPAQDEKSPQTEHPEQLSLDEWGVWAQRRDGEPMDAWRERVDYSNRGLNAFEFAKRMRKFSKEDIDYIMRRDPESIEHYMQNSEENHSWRKNIPKHTTIDDLPF